MKSHCSSFVTVAALVVAATAITQCSVVTAFSPTYTALVATTTQPTLRPTEPKKSRLAAGGFEWEDPVAEAFDQGVGNPFKNTELVLQQTDEGLGKIDPARLLSPRMNGSNLYLIGMMGSGKSAVGKIVAKRK
jgi:hypothetical protein